MELTLETRPAFHILTETGPADAQALRHYTHTMHEDDLLNHRTRLRMAQEHIHSFPYHIYTTPPDTESIATGVAVLIHRHWITRQIKKPYIHPSNRWIRMSFRGPLSVITLYGTYCRVNPTTTNLGGQEWEVLLTDIAKHHAKGHAIIVAGDINMSYNSTQYRSKIDEHDHIQQHLLLERALTRFGLVDAYPHLYPSRPQQTWCNTTGDWSSPDHILISQQLTSRLRYGLTVDLPWTDHSNVTIDIDYKTSLSIRYPTRSRVKRNKDDMQKYADKVELTLSTHPPPTSSADRVQTLMTAMQTVERELWLKKGHVRRGRKRSETLLQRELTKALTWRKTPPKHRPQILIQDQEPSVENIDQLIKNLKKLVNKQSKIRTHARHSIYVQNRTEAFLENRLKNFLTSALGRYTSYSGIIGYILPSGGAITDPTLVKVQATKRIATEFFRLRAPPPPFITDSTAPIPDWWRRIFPHTLNPQESDPLYDKVLDPISLRFLNNILKHMHSNKSGGPSGLVVESFRWLRDDTKEVWLLPVINECLSTGTVPRNVKDFQVWATEKIQGEGALLTHMGKINVRPIALFEVAYKIIESVIQRRLQGIITHHGKLHHSQYGFTPHKGVDDLLIIYRLILEDAHHRNQELHLSSNDCSQAYDSTPQWAMQEIYKCPRFPPRLIKLLLDLDTDQTGKLITAHGTGPPFPKLCGLGQGSVLAPLKSNLFLDPLLRELHNIGDPYILPDPTNGLLPTHLLHLAAKAFADDVSVFGPNHNSYMQRMTFKNTYLNFFGVQVNHIKTKYSFTRSPSSYQAPAMIKDCRTGEQRPTCVISPHTPTRLLGGLMSLSLHWDTARKKLLDDLHSILNVLQYKRLQSKEFIYIMNAVLVAKLRYYTNVVPLSQENVQELDVRIRTIFKRMTGLPSSFPTHLLYLPESHSGYGLPSVSHHVDINLISQANRILNDTTILGVLARGNLILLQKHAGLTGNPLLTPTICNSWPTKFWTSAVAAALHRKQGHFHSLQSNLQLHLPRELTFNIDMPNPRPNDTPLHEVLGPQFPSFLPHIRHRPERFVSDFASPCGRKFHHPDLTSSLWIQKLKKQLTTPPTNTLRYPTSPTPTPIQFITAQHPPKSIVGLPIETAPNQYRYDDLLYFQVINTYPIDSEPMVDLHPLLPVTNFPTIMSDAYHKITNFSVKPDRKWRPIKTYTGHLRIPSHEIIVSKAKDLHQITSFTSVPIRTHHHTKTGYLITPTDTLTLAKSSVPLTGSLSAGTIIEIVQRQQRSCYVQNDLVYDVEDDSAPCTICGLHGAVIVCETQTHCTGVFHPQCLPDDSHKHITHWTCERCRSLPSEDAPWLEPLTPQELKELRSASALRSASDGSVRPGKHPSSSFGFVITDETGRVLVRRKRRIDIRAADQSSFRAEMEALTGVYTTLPPDLTSDHTLDNESTQTMHNILAKLHSLPLDRRWLNKTHFPVIWRLYQAICSHDQPLPLTHTLSHLEDEFTEDMDLHTRRMILQIADILAAEAHSTPAAPPPITGHPLFSLHLHSERVETDPTSALHKEFHKTLLNQLSSNPHRPAILQVIDPVNASSWPQFLRTFFIKIITDRLPTRATRHKRQDKHADGSLVSPHCTACKMSPPAVETREHFLYDCTTGGKRRWLHLQKTVTFFRQFVPPNYEVNENALDYIRTHQIAQLDKGWTRTWTDKHKRVVEKLQGQEVVATQYPPYTLRPDMYVALTLTGWDMAHDTLPPFKPCIDPAILISLAGKVTNPTTSSPLAALPGSPYTHHHLDDIPTVLTSDEASNTTYIFDLTYAPYSTVLSTIRHFNKLHNSSPTTAGIIFTTHPHLYSQWPTAFTIPAHHISIIQPKFWTGLHPWRNTHNNAKPITVLTH